MKIYTKKGDDGTTGLLGGSSVPKHYLRIEAYGTVDEPNSYLGTLLSDIQPLHQDVTRLENEVDAMYDVLPPMKNFVLPGGHMQYRTATWLEPSAVELKDVWLRSMIMNRQNPSS